MPTYSRPSRKYKFVASIGSSVTIDQIGDDGVPANNPTTFDIRIGTLVEIPFNADVTNSGSAGGILRERVGADWNFALSLQLPASILATEVTPAFVDDLLGSQNKVLMTFFMGDPTWWTARGLSSRSKRGTALLSLSEVRLDNTGKQVVGVNVAGEGDDLLVRYLGDTPHSQSLWF